MLKLKLKNLKYLFGLIAHFHNYNIATNMNINLLILVIDA